MSFFKRTIKFFEERKGRSLPTHLLRRAVLERAGRSLLLSETAAVLRFHHKPSVLLRLAVPGRSAGVHPDTAQVKRAAVLQSQKSGSQDFQASLWFLPPKSWGKRAPPLPKSHGIVLTFQELFYLGLFQNGRSSCSTSSGIFSAPFSRCCKSALVKWGASLGNKSKSKEVSWNGSSESTLTILRFDQRS